jgi:TRAP-type C4-dicarboxylate transport system substrate-binding protein
MRVYTKKSIITAFILSFVATVLCPLYLNSAPIELRWANYFPIGTAHTKIMEEFIRDIEAKTQGKVKFSYYPAGTLLTAPKMYDGVEKGLADLGFCNIGYTFGRFKVTEALDMPVGYNTEWVATHVANDFYRKFRPKEWDNVHVLSFSICGLNVLMTATRPVYTLEDLKGLNIRGTGYIAEVVSALGGTPRAIPTPEAYDAVLKKVIDGLYISMETLRAFRYAEVIKYVTEIWFIGQGYTFYLIMNKNTWNKLPTDVKKVFDEYPFEEKFAKMWNEIDIDGKKYGLEKGIKFIQLSPGERTKWIKATEPVIDKYVKRMVSEGFSEKEVRGWISFIKERRDYWTQKQRELGIKSSTGPDDLRVEFK